MMYEKGIEASKSHNSDLLEKNWGCDITWFCNFLKKHGFISKHLHDKATRIERIIE